MKKLYLTTFTLLFATLTFAQEYDISSYKFRYQKYKGFTLSPSLNTRNNQQFNNENNQNKPSPDFRNINNWSANLNLNANYFENINVEELQQSTRISSGNDLSWRTAKRVSSVGRLNSSSNDLSNRFNASYQRTTRNYQTNNTFRYRNLSSSLSSSIQRNMRDNNQIKEDLQIDKLQNISTSISASFGRGKGRIDNVTDLIQAHFILEDLRLKKGIEYSSDQLEQVAQGITYIRNQRYLDFRFRTIDQLTMLDSTISSAGIASEKDMKYFATLNDNWLYGTNLGRTTGKRWSYYYTPGVELFGERTKDLRRLNNGDTIINNNRYDLSYENTHSLTSDFSIEYLNVNQQSWKVQQSFSARLDVGTSLTTKHNRGEINDSNFIQPERKEFNPTYEFMPTINLSASWQHLYQPNSRTYYIANISPRISFEDTRYNDPSGADWYYRENNLFPEVQCDFNYYKWLNPQLGINMRASARVTYERINGGPIGPNKPLTRNNVHLMHNASIGVTYQLY